MSIAKTIEVSAKSSSSFDDAVKTATAEVRKTVKNVKQIYVKDFLADVGEDGSLTYRVHCQVTFIVDASNRDEIS